MAGLRSYQDPCGIARALDVVGERWALLIVRELVFGPKRFTDLREGLGGASRNVLAQRLRELEDGGVVRRSRTGAPTYELTDRGQELHPILLQLGRWGAKSTVRPAGRLSVDALMVALESTFSPRAAGNLNMTCELRLGEARFTVAVHEGTISIARGAGRQPDVIIEGEANTLRAVVFGDRRLGDAPSRSGATSDSGAHSCACLPVLDRLSRLSSSTSLSVISVYRMCRCRRSRADAHPLRCARRNRLAAGHGLTLEAGQLKLADHLGDPDRAGRKWIALESGCLLQSPAPEFSWRTMSRSIR